MPPLAVKLILTHISVWRSKSGLNSVAVWSDGMMPGVYTPYHLEFEVKSFTKGGFPVARLLLRNKNRGHSAICPILRNLFYWRS